MTSFGKDIDNEIARIHSINELDTNEYERVLGMVKTFVEKNGVDAIPEMVQTWKDRFKNAPSDKKEVWGGWIPALEFALASYNSSVSDDSDVNESEITPQMGEMLLTALEGITDEIHLLFNNIPGYGDDPFKSKLPVVRNYIDDLQKQIDDMKNVFAQVYLIGAEMETLGTLRVADAGSQIVNIARSLISFDDILNRIKDDELRRAVEHARAMYVRKERKHKRALELLRQVSEASPQHSALFMDTGCCVFCGADVDSGAPHNASCTLQSINVLLENENGNRNG